MIMLQEIVDSIVWSRDAHALCPEAPANPNAETDNRDDYLDLNHNDDHPNFEEHDDFDEDVVSISSCDDEHEFNNVVELAEEHPHVPRREVSAV